MRDLFEAQESDSLPLASGAVQLRGFACDAAAALWAGVQQVVALSTWRHLQTPGGLRMSVAMTNCGALGWVSDRSGYRYEAAAPLTGAPWPAMPTSFLTPAQAAAQAAGYDGFAPDACLVNRYAPGTRLSLHQDRDEDDRVAPIVSVSLGLPATFLFGGFQRADPTVRVPLQHGDVVVWGDGDRMRFHGVLPIKPGRHELLGEQRINLTFRKVR